MTATPVTPAEAKAVWDSLKEPSARKVAAKFEAAGRKISFKSIAKWKREGWGARTAEQIEASASKAVEAINVALPAITGDVTSKLGNAGGAPPVQQAPGAGADPTVCAGGPADLEDVAKPASTASEAASAQTSSMPAPPTLPDDRTNAERAEDALLAAITGATTVWRAITDLATMKPPAGAPGEDAPPIMLLVHPEGMAKLMKASSEAISRAIEDYKQIPNLRAEAAAAVLGTQTVYPPGEGPHADADFPLSSAMKAFDDALKGIRERKSA